jgi:hypothetical protein
MAIGVALALFAVCALSVANGWFYDDEIFNISAYSPSYKSIITMINTQDVHPPGSYILNKFFYDLTGSWKSVQIIGGLLLSVGSGILFWALAPRLSPKSRWILAGLLASFATGALWGASLRWYAYFGPLYLTAVAIVFADIRHFPPAAIGLALLTIMMIYVSYISLIMVPPLWLALFWRQGGWPPGFRASRVWLLASLGMATVAAATPQLLVFLHMGSKSAGQTSSIVASLGGVAYTVLMGNALLPQAPLAIAGAAAVTVAGLFSLKRIKEPFFRDFLVVFAVTALAIGLSGLGGKVRNAMFLIPLAAVIWAIGLDSAPRWLSRIALVVIAAMQLASVVNVILHHNTSKGSFNKPYGQVLSRLAGDALRCPGAHWVLTSDTVLTYLVQQKGYSVSAPALPPHTAPITLRPGDCLSVVKSDNANLSAADYARFTAFNGGAGLTPTANEQIGLDSAAAFKTRMGVNRPAYFFSLQEYRAIAPALVQGWAASRP